MINITKHEEATAELQRFLYELSFRWNWLSRVYVDGIYSNETEEAVKSFQSRFDMEPTGRADYRTWQALYQAYSDSMSQRAQSESDTYQSDLRHGLPQNGSPVPFAVEHRRPASSVPPSASIPQSEPPLSPQMPLGSAHPFTQQAPPPLRTAPPPSCTPPPSRTIPPPSRTTPPPAHAAPPGTRRQPLYPGITEPSPEPSYPTPPMQDSSPAPMPQNSSPAPIPQNSSPAPMPQNSSPAPMPRNTPQIPPGAEPPITQQAPPLSSPALPFTFSQPNQAPNMPDIRRLVTDSDIMPPPYTESPLPDIDERSTNEADALSHFMPDAPTLIPRFKPRKRPMKE